MPLMIHSIGLLISRTGFPPILEVSPVLPNSFVGLSSPKSDDTNEISIHTDLLP